MNPRMYTGEDVSIGDVSFNRVDEYGCEWVLTDLDGWWGLPTPEVENHTRPFVDDGSYLTYGRFASRNIVLTGRIVPKIGTNGIFAARRSLNESVEAVRRTQILTVRESVPKQARVQLFGKANTKIDSLNNNLEFNIQLRASDPRKYAVDSTSGSAELPASVPGRTYPKSFNYAYGNSTSFGVIPIYNSGSYQTFGTIRITGPVVNPSIELVEQNATLSFNISLGVGDYLDIDLQSRSVTLNGSASRRGTVTKSSNWFTIPAGSSTLRFRGIQIVPTPPAMVYLTYRSAWLE